VDDFVEAIQLMQFICGHSAGSLQHSMTFSNLTRVAFGEQTG